MIYFIGLIILMTLISMMVIFIRNDKSRMSVFIPGFNYYSRTQIAGRGIGLSIITSILSFILVLIVGFERYRSTPLLLSVSSITQSLLLLLQSLPQVIQSHRGYLIPRLLLQIWVNRGVAHRQGRGLLSGIELTILPFIYWLALIGQQKTSENSEEM